MNLNNLDHRLSKLEGKHASGRVEWQLQDGSSVAFTTKELLEALFALMGRIYRAMKGAPPGPLPDPAQAVLDAAPEERARLNRQITWARDLESYYLEQAANPAPEDAAIVRGER